MTATPPDHDLLTARELSCVRGGVHAVRAASLTLRQGEVAGVSGARGSGRSTLLACLAGAVPCDGEVWFHDIPLHTLPRAARDRFRRERFGWVGDTPRLLPELTAWENVALPLLLTGVPHRRARRTALEWLERLDAGRCADARPAALTRSQEQRVAIARAFTVDPAVLFTDDPAGPLQSADRTHAVRTLVTAARAHGVTVLLAGAAEEVAAFADRRWELADGTLRASEAPALGSACPVSA